MTLTKVDCEEYLITRFAQEVGFHIDYDTGVTGPERENAIYYLKRNDWKVYDARRDYIADLKDCGK